MTRKVLVVTSEHFWGAEMPYVLKKAGCAVDVFSPDGAWLLKNSHWDEWIEADLSSDDAFAAGLSRLAATGLYDWIVPLNDETIRILNDRISDSTLFLKLLPLSKIEHRAFLGSKAGLSRLCTACGITTPPYLIHEGSPGILPSIKEFAFPLLIKLDRSSGGNGVFLCPDEASFEAKWQAIRPEDKHGLVIQSYIAGDNIAVETLYRNGVLLGYASATVIKTSGGEFGVSTEREYREYPGLEAELQKIGAAFGLNGFVNMTFMYEPRKGIYYLVEADTRPNEWIALCAFAGMDFSEAARNYLSGNDVLLRPSESIAHPVVIRHFERQIACALKQKDIKTLLKWCLNREGRFRDIPTYDPVLFRATIGFLVSHSLHQIPKNAKKLFASLAPTALPSRRLSDPKSSELSAGV